MLLLPEIGIAALPRLPRLTMVCVLGTLRKIARDKHPLPSSPLRSPDKAPARSRRPAAGCNPAAPPGEGLREEPCPARRPGARLSSGTGGTGQAVVGLPPAAKEEVGKELRLGALVARL